MIKGSSEVGFGVTRASTKGSSVSMLESMFSMLLDDCCCDDSMMLTFCFSSCNVVNAVRVGR
jgi:hypothetical protein